MITPTDAATSGIGSSGGCRRAPLTIRDTATEPATNWAEVKSLDVSVTLSRTIGPEVGRYHPRHDARSHRHQRKTAAGMGRAADQIEPSGRAPVGGAQEGGPAPVGRRSVDRTARRRVASFEVGR